MFIELNGTAASEVIDASAMAGVTSAVLRGQGGNDTLIGTTGADRFDGGTGADSMIGGSGDDRFFLDYRPTQSGRDSVDGGLGADMIVYQFHGVPLTATIKAELVRLSLYAEKGDFSSNFISDVLRLDVTDVDAVLLRVDGLVNRVADVIGGPVGIADAYLAAEDTPLTVTASMGVLANDGAEAGGLTALAATITTARGGTVVLAADGGFTYAPVADAFGADSFTYTLVDALKRTAIATANIAILPVNDPATIGGTFAGSVQEDGTLFAAGVLTIADPDGWDLGFQTPASLAGTYGTFSFNGTTGAWGYTLDNAAANVQALAAGQTVTDTLTVTSLDGTATQAITVSIAGGAESIDVTALAGATGFRILGAAAGDEAGFALATGDVNGDGKADILVGAPGADGPVNTDNGAVWIVWGTGASRDDVALATPGAEAVKVAGGNSDSNFGTGVAFLGDVTGDGLGDWAGGAWRARANDDGEGYGRGAGYLVQGATTGFDLPSAVSAGKAALWFGQYEDVAGWSVARIGDLNGDGKPEFVVGAESFDGYGINSGVAYVVWDKAMGQQALGLAGGGGTSGYRVIGATGGDTAGHVVSSVADLNGDGLDEVLVAAPLADALGRFDAGTVYVSWGKTTTAQLNLGDVAAGTGGFAIHGERAFDLLGGGAESGDQNGDDVTSTTLASIADLNGDGLAEILVGAPMNDSGGEANNGAAYVVWGKASGTAVDLRDVANGTGGFKIVGEAGSDQAGTSVAGIGDLNGDGIAEILVAAPNADGGAGAAYIVWGKDDTATVQLSEVAAGRGGLKIMGFAIGDLVTAVAAAPDMNGDGRPDILVGATGADQGGTDSGTVHVVYSQADWLMI